MNSVSVWFRSSPSLALGVMSYVSPYPALHHCPTLHEGMHFVAASDTEVATRLSTLWAVVSLAARSILR
jgi:hypothetical protein